MIVFLILWLYYTVNKPRLQCHHDDKGVRMAHKIKTPKNQPQISQTTMGQHWLGIVKLSPNKFFSQIDPKFFQKVATDFFLF